MTHECTPESCDGNPVNREAATEEELNSLRRRLGLDEHVAALTKAHLYRRIETLQAQLAFKNQKLKEAEERLALLAALEAAGVDNWDGYSYAMSLLGDDDDDT